MPLDDEYNPCTDKVSENVRNVRKYLYYSIVYPCYSTTPSFVEAAEYLRCPRS